MLNIKGIALKVAGEIYDVNFDEHKPSGKRLISFAEALIAELAKQNEPVAWWNGKETAFFEHETDGPVGEVKIPLYTFPPTAEQIANETAEACARICDYKHNQPVELIEVAKTQSECAEALRSGAWKEFK